MKMGMEGQMKINFESSKERERRLTESVQEARKNKRGFTQEESDFIDQQNVEEGIERNKLYRS